MSKRPKTKRRKPAARPTPRAAAANESTSAPQTILHPDLPAVPTERAARAARAEPHVPAAAIAAPFVSPKYLWLIRALLWMLLALGVAWRFVGLNWDAGHHLHPDERFLTMVVPDLALPSSMSDWFRTASSTFNPFVRHEGTGLFVYGQLPLLIAKLVAVPLQQDSYDGILIVGRALSALFDAGTVAMTLLVGRRLLGRDGGLLAAIVLAFTALHIQLAHFYTVDTFATFFLVLCFWSLLRWLEHTHARWAIATGAAWGLSAACKISTVLFAPIILLALLFPLATLLLQRRTRAGESHARASFGTIILGALALGLGAFVCFRVFHPMGFRGEAGPSFLGGLADIRPAGGTTINGVTKTFWTSFAEQRDITSGQGDVPWNLQWFGRTNFWWPLRNLLVWGIGWQALLPALAALPWLAARLARRRKGNLEDAAWILVAVWALFGFSYNAVQYSKFSRYFLIVTPFFALLAAWFAMRAWEWAQQKHHQYLARHAELGHAAARNRREDWHKHLPMGAALLVGAMLGGTVCWGSAVASIYRVPNSRVQASEFLRSLPERTRIARETEWDDAVPLTEQERFEMIDLKILEHEDAAWRGALLDSLDRSEWMGISSPRMWASLPRLPMRFPLATRYYQALFSGELGLVPEREFTVYPEVNLLGWRLQFADDNTEEALTVYDHPRVVLWQHGASWARQNAESILDASLLEQVDEAPLKELIERGASVDEAALPWMPSPATQK